MVRDRPHVAPAEPRVRISSKAYLTYLPLVREGDGTTYARRVLSLHSGRGDHFSALVFPRIREAFSEQERRFRKDAGRRFSENRMFDLGHPCVLKSRKVPGMSMIIALKNYRSTSARTHRSFISLRYTRVVSTTHLRKWRCFYTRGR